MATKQPLKKKYTNTVRITPSDRNNVFMAVAMALKKQLQEEECILRNGT